VIAGNLRCAASADGLLESQGAVALVGPTGVGKTTTVAKLAARFAVRYGAAQLGLITLDSYRIGAHEQLRSYGRILGVPMHIAQDGATLRELLASLHGKRLVLIDTCGLSQRDERLEEMLSTLSAARFNVQAVRPVLLLNAASHSESLDEVARAWARGRRRLVRFWTKNGRGRSNRRGGRLHAALSDDAVRPDQRSAGPRGLAPGQRAPARAPSP